VISGQLKEWQEEYGFTVEYVLPALDDASNDIAESGLE
jgi:hypothetical protein